MIPPLRYLLAAAACAAAGCTISESHPRADSTAADTAAASRAIATPAAAVLPDSAPPTSAIAPTSAVAFTGVAPLRVGMTAREAREALGLPPQTTPTTPESCSYLDLKGKPLHAFVMMTSDTIVRFDVRDNTLATEAGARVGDSEATVVGLYRGRVRIQPHKYLPSGHNLVVTTPADSALRLVFETDGKQVTAYHAGRRPEVEYVEGCG